MTCTYLLKEGGEKESLNERIKTNRFRKPSIIPLFKGGGTSLGGYDAVSRSWRGAIFRSCVQYGCSL